MSELSQSEKEAREHLSEMERVKLREAEKKQERPVFPNEPIPTTGLKKLVPVDTGRVVWEKAK